MSIHAYKNFIYESLAIYNLKQSSRCGKFKNILDISYSIQANIWNIKPKHWKREKMDVKQPYSLHTKNSSFILGICI